MNTFELGNLVRSILLEPEQKAFQRSVEILINKNKGENEASHNMFMFGGVVYKTKTLVSTNHNVPSLDITLVKEMQENLRMLKESKREVQNVWQAILPIVELNGAENGLPDCLKTVLPKRFGSRVISFEAALGQCPDMVRKNWASAEKLLYYFISLRLTL
jgi:hypothetical protein